jgi:hypothetical protein
VGAAGAAEVAAVAAAVVGAGGDVAGEQADSTPVTVITRMATAR